MWGTLDHGFKERGIAVYDLNVYMGVVIYVRI